MQFEKIALMLLYSDSKYGECIKSIFNLMYFFLIDDSGIWQIFFFFFLNGKGSERNRETITYGKKWEIC